MSRTSGKHSDNKMPEKNEAARVIAKLLASRRTPIEEIPRLIKNVERALTDLRNEGPGPAATPSTPEDVMRQRAKRAVASPRPIEPQRGAPAAPDAAAIKPVPPTLLRRAEVVHDAPAAPAAPLAAPTPGAAHGVVQWFDTRSGRGTLRLQGLSSDLAIDAETLAGFGLTRLFKGQEIEATLEGAAESPKITGLRLANLAPVAPVSGGTVRDRHAKQVVVELKREALSRAAARAEAELLIPTRRAR